MEWTKEQPAKAGHYWLRDKDGDIDVVNVQDWRDSGELRAMEIGREQSLLLSHEIYVGVEWYGPIESPK